MKKKLIIGAIVAVIVIGAVWYYLKTKKGAAPSNNQQQNNTNPAQSINEVSKPASSPLILNPVSTASPVVEKITLVQSSPSNTNPVIKTQQVTYPSAPLAASKDSTLSSKAALTKILRSKKWNAGGEKTWTGEYLNIEVLPDGSVKIGDGYRGQVVDMSTIVTKERHGQTSTQVTWKAV